MSTPYLRERRDELLRDYRDALLRDVAPFWLRHGLDREHGGMLTALGRRGEVIDTDKSVWFQGRAGWTYATLYRRVERRPEWLDAALSCVRFLRDHCAGPSGKLLFTVTREGQPLRMRRYVFAESFAAIADAAGIGLMWGCMDDSRIAIAAALHAALACPATRYLDLDGHLDLSTDFATGGFTLEGGVLRPLDRPGLGLVAG